ncbi:MAG: transglycosylase SLT domain-containing protein [Armatimonadetes bacterium]|nr:transglycosylase SLT domain-containing protein [Armatimonadota bacterium]
MAIAGLPYGGFSPMGCCGGGGMDPFMMMQLMQMLQMIMGSSGRGGCGCCGGGGYGYPGMGYGDALGGYLGMPGYDGGYGGGYDGYGGGYSPYGMPWQSPYVPPFGNVPYNQGAGGSLADVAASWNGRHFKPGQTKRCADFVSTMIEQSGTAPPGFRHEMSAAGLARYGQQVNPGELRPGDLVFFGNTYRPGKYTHVGIYMGNGRFVHRPTANAPVRVDRLDSGYYARKLTDARRLPAAGGRAGAPGGYGGAGGYGGYGGYGGGPGGYGGYGGPGGYGGYGGYGDPGGYGGRGGNWGSNPADPSARIPNYGPNPGAGQVDQMLAAAAAKYGIPPNILKAVAWQESGWRANASSFDGGHGKGIMQIDDRFHQFARTQAVWNPSQNIEYGARYLRELYDKTGSWQEALRRYNGGSSYPPKIFAHAQSQPWARRTMTA